MEYMVRVLSLPLIEVEVFMKLIEYSVGDTVYFVNTWTNECHKGLVTEVVKQDDEYYAKLNDLTTVGSTARPFSKLFRSEEECKISMSEEKESVIEEYSKEITSVRELLLFMYSHRVCLCEEYTDWEAREVCKRKAKELLGMNLN